MLSTHLNIFATPCLVTVSPSVASALTNRTLQYQCSTKEELLLQIAIDVDKDDKQIHPQQMQCLQHKTITSHRICFNICLSMECTHSAKMHEHFHKHSYGRGPLQVARGRPSTAIESLQNSANPSWGDGQPLCLSRFIPPSHSVLLSDLQCKKCAT